MTLREYRRKRDFRRTPEPRGGRGAKTARGQRATRAPSGLSFVIQKHAASRLHYDFRLEMEGVLRSWAVPKGPSLDPAQRRLAAHVEDHPIEYGGFEGIIPRGEYGGGTVLLWDRGTWTPLGDPVASYRAGKLKFRLDGEKLRGGWTLVRMGGRAADGGKNWLLIKERDGDARPGGREIVDAKPKSVATGRSIEQIAKASDRVWHSKESGNGEAKRVKKPAVVPAAARRAALPRTFSPQLATLVAEAPDGDEWLHEIKLDGYRIVARLENGRARLLSRSGKDWTARLPTIARAVEKLRARSALLDGEVVALLPDGTSSFQALQNALSEGGEPELVYYVFDLVHLDGRSLAALAQEERKTALASLLGSSPPRPIRYSDHGVGHGAEFKRHACRLALEGIVSKRRDAPYHSGRGRDWLKTKCIHEQELVIGGFTAPSGARTGFGSLLLGVHDRDGHLRYAGHVGTGFTAASLAELRRKLEGLEQRETPFASPPREAYGRGVKWVKPELVAAVEFTEWTRDGQLRHPSFQGLREDKPAREVVREEAERMDEIEDDPKRERPKTKRAPRAKAPSASAESVGGARLTHPDRVLYPDAGITKRALAEYYVAVADRMLPHVAGRPLTIVRCPEGQTGECFYQKHAGDSAPASLRRIPIREEGKAATYLALDGVDGLVGLVQMSALEIHVWGAHDDDVERPDFLVFDLDPDPAVAWNDVVAGAKHVRDRLEELGLRSFVKTTGGKGLHVCVPIRRRLEWDAVKAFSKSLAESIVADAPERWTANPLKARRKGRIFLDYLRNGRGATFIAPYSSRARAGAPVSMPVAWEELGADVRADSFTVANVAARLARTKRDPWADVTKVRQSVTDAMVRELAKR